MRAGFLAAFLFLIPGCVQGSVFISGGPCPLGPPWLGAWTEPGLFANLPVAGEHHGVRVDNVSRVEGESLVFAVFDEHYGQGNWTLIRLGWRHEFETGGRDLRHVLFLGPGDSQAKVEARFDKPVSVEQANDAFRDFVRNLTDAATERIETWTRDFSDQLSKYADEPRVSYLDATVIIEGPFTKARFVSSMAPLNPKVGLPGGAKFEREDRFLEIALATQALGFVNASLPRLVVDVGDRVSLEVDGSLPPTPVAARDAAAALLAPLGLPRPRGFPTEFHPNVVCAAVR